MQEDDLVRSEFLVTQCFWGVELHEHAWLMDEVDDVRFGRESGASRLKQTTQSLNGQTTRRSKYAHHEEHHQRKAACLKGWTVYRANPYQSLPFTLRLRL